MTKSAERVAMRKLFAISWMCIAAVGCAGRAGWGDAADGGNSILPGSSGGGSSDGGGPIALGGGGLGDGGGAGLSSTSVLTVTIRDFKFWNRNDATTNPDFENVVQDDRGIVADTLGTDHKPVYKNATGMTPTTHGKKYFDQWYNDVPGTNLTVQHPLTLTKGPQSTYGYDSLVSGVPLSGNDPRKMWFPIDDGTSYATAFGNQGRGHNYSFTTELHTIFTYNGGESFSFTGDDDVFVFINNKLVIDLGGVHAIERGSVQLDSLGLVKGQQYPLDLFNAERHTAESNLSFTTTLVLQPIAQ